jgi:hypothetical protein
MQYSKSGMNYRTQNPNLSPHLATTRIRHPPLNHGVDTEFTHLEKQAVFATLLRDALSSCARMRFFCSEMTEKIQMK